MLGSKPKNNTDSTQTATHLIRCKSLNGLENSGNLRLLQLRHMQHHIEGGCNLHLLHDQGIAGCAQDQQLAALGGLPLQQHQQRLQDGVAESGPDGDVLQQPLDVVQNDH